MNPIQPKNPNFIDFECEAPTHFCGSCGRGHCFYSGPSLGDMKSPCCNDKLWTASGGERFAMPSPPLH
jgi:hypothetical protein